MSDKRIRDLKKSLRQAVAQKLMEALRKEGFYFTDQEWERMLLSLEEAIRGRLTI